MSELKKKYQRLQSMLLSMPFFHNNEGNATQQDDCHVDKKDRYRRRLDLVEEKRKGLEMQTSHYSEIVSKIQVKLKDKEEEASTQSNMFKAFILNLSKDREKNEHEDLKKIQMRVDKYCKEIDSFRLKEINLHKTCTKLKRCIKQHEKLIDGISVTDFDLLQSRQTKLEKKIQERRSEIEKLQVRRERIVHLTDRIKQKSKNLMNSNYQLTQELNSMKTLDDKLHRSVQCSQKKLREVCKNTRQFKEHQAFTGNKRLLEDFRETAKVVAKMRGELENLKRDYFLLCDNQRKVSRDNDESPLDSSIHRIEKMLLSSG